MKKPPPALAGRLLDHSEQVFSGELARLEDVAAAVRVSRATLYYYFAGQDDLRGFLIGQHVRGGAAVIAAADSPEDPAELRLRQTVAAMVGYLGQRPGFCTGLLGSVGASGELGAALQLNDAEIGEPLRRLLGQGVASGEFEILDLRAAADAILGAVLFAVLGRAREGASAVDGDFADGVAGQLVAGVTPSAGPVG